jgi:hypothetical protein
VLFGVVGTVDLDALLTGAQAARAVGVYRQLIRRWAQLGRLTAAAKGPRGEPLYRYRDVLRAEQATRRSKQSHRIIVAA